MIFVASFKGEGLIEDFSTREDVERDCKEECEDHGQFSNGDEKSGNGGQNHGFNWVFLIIFQ